MNVDKEREEGDKARETGSPVLSRARDADAGGFFMDTFLPFATRHGKLVAVVFWLIASAISAVQGPAFVMIMLIAGALVLVISLFWSSLRTLMGETPLSG